MNENDLVLNIAELLRSESPQTLQSNVDEFLRLVELNQMRPSYRLLLDLLTKVENWQPSSQLRALIKAYEVIF